jgi:L,D-transpeptidase ErfK/SrfK
MSPLVIAVLLATHPGASRGDEVFGSVGVHVVAEGESLIEIARQYDVGWNEIAAANPGLDAFIPTVGVSAVIPTSWILPAAAEPGTLVVNLSEMRLYWLGARLVPPVTYPVGVAVEPGATPLRVLTVIAKAVDPTWHPTAAIRSEDPTLPGSVPPGPDNPLGSHALRLSIPTILIHGTNKPFGVGRKVTHGCIRLYPEDIPNLYRLVRVGTKVRIVREPVKVGEREGRIFVEVHDDDELSIVTLAEADALLRARGMIDRVNVRRLVAAVRAKSGVPVDVTAVDVTADAR